MGELRVVVAPSYRKKGLGTALMRELASVANSDPGIERLLLQQVLDKEKDAVKTAEFVGFKRAAVLRGHAKNPDGTRRDMVLMEMLLEDRYDWAS